MASFTFRASGTHLPGQAPERPTEDEHERRQKGLLWFLAYLLNAVRKFGKELNPRVDFRKDNLPKNVFSPKPAVEIKKEICGNPDVLAKKYTHSRSGQLVLRETRTRGGNRTYYLIKAFFPEETHS